MSPSITNYLICFRQQNGQVVTGLEATDQFTASQVSSAANKWCTGDEEGALKELGKALDAVMDSASAADRDVNGNLLVRACLRIAPPWEDPLTPTLSHRERGSELFPPPNWGSGRGFVPGLSIALALTPTLSHRERERKSPRPSRRR